MSEIWRKTIFCLYVWIPIFTITQEQKVVKKCLQKENLIRLWTLYGQKRQKICSLVCPLTIFIASGKRHKQTSRYFKKLILTSLLY